MTTTSQAKSPFGWNKPRPFCDCGRPVGTRRIGNLLICDRCARLDGWAEGKGERKAKGQGPKTLNSQRSTSDVQRFDPA